jgi:hypothetical protein
MFKSTYEMTVPAPAKNRDYRWRTSVRRSDFTQVVMTLAEEISYTNFNDHAYDAP